MLAERFNPSHQNALVCRDGVHSWSVDRSPCGHRPWPETTKTRRWRRPRQSCLQLEGGTQRPDCQVPGATAGFRPGDRVSGVPRV